MERYLIFYRSGKLETSSPPSEVMVERASSLIHEMTLAGVLLAVEGCLPTEHGARVRNEKGEIVASDGPFTDIKEIISGVVLLQTKSKADAIHWSKRLLTVLGEGSVEVRLLANIG
jgi:hypothetical protein